MNQMIRIAPVRKSVVVETSAAKAFDVFTSGIDRWWPRQMGGQFITKSVIEPFVGGRWYTVRENAPEVTVGHVLKWVPGEIFASSWEVSMEFRQGPEARYASEIEVRFIAEGANRTRVELEHRAFERLGEEAERMQGAVGGGWPRVLEHFVTAANASS